MATSPGSEKDTPGVNPSGASHAAPAPRMGDDLVDVFSRGAIRGPSATRDVKTAALSLPATVAIASSLCAIRMRLTAGVSAA